MVLVLLATQSHIPMPFQIVSLKFIDIFHKINHDGWHVALLCVDAWRKFMMTGAF